MVIFSKKRCQYVDFPETGPLNWKVGRDSMTETFLYDAKLFKKGLKKDLKGGTEQ